MQSTDYGRVALAGILVLAASLRLYAINSQSLWLDELITLGDSTGNYRNNPRTEEFDVVISPPLNFTELEYAKPIATFWRSLVPGEHPPLYLLVLRIWREVFGNGDLAARSLSAAVSVLGVFLIYCLGKELFGRAVGLWAALLMTVAGPQIWFGQETRSYAMLTTVSLAAALALVLIQKRSPSWWRAILLSFLLLCMPLTHYFSFGVLLALGLYMVLRLRGRSLRWALGAAAVACLLFLILWGPFLWQSRHSTYHEFLVARDPDHLVRSFHLAAEMPIRLLVHLQEAWGPMHPSTWLLLLVYVAPVPLLARKPDLLLPWLWLVLTVGFVLCLDLARTTNHLYRIRYVMLAGPGLYLLLPALLSHLKGFGHVPPLLAVVVAVVTLRYPYAESRPDYRGMWEAVQQRARPTDAFVFSGAESATQAHWLYLSMNHYAFDPDRTHAILTRPPSPRVQDALRRAGRVWVFIPPDGVLYQQMAPGADAVPGMGYRLPGVGSFFLVEYRSTPGGLR